MTPLCRLVHYFFHEKNSCRDPLDRFAEWRVYWHICRGDEKLNPDITRGEAYEFGNTYGAYFILLSVGLIVYLAATNRLSGAKSRH